MGWVANIFICIGLWKQGSKIATAYVFTIIGEAIWCIYSLYSKQYDLAFICVIFCVLAARNLWKWRNDSVSDSVAK